MLDSILHPIKFPPYSSLKSYEGQGNWAIGKYYKLPYRPFYRKKLYMIRDMLDKGRIYKNIMDFGSGPGIFSHELRKHAISVTSVDRADIIDHRWKFECIVAGSTFEFIEKLPMTFLNIYRAASPKSQLIVASPMDTKLTRAYFKLIGDNLVRNSHETICTIMDKWFQIDEYKEWNGLYFVAKGYKR